MYGSQRPADFVKKFEQPYAALLSAGVKFQASLGNHDRPEHVNYRLYNMNGQRYYTYVRNNVRFFALDTTLMDPRQREWIEASLRDAREDWKICYFHHPLYSNADRHGASVDLRVLLEPIFIKYGVNVVFSGHDHVYERLKPQKGIHYFVSGSAGKLRKGNMSPTEETAASFDQDQSFMARGGRRRRDVLSGDLAYRQDGGFRRDPPARGKWHAGEQFRPTTERSMTKKRRWRAAVPRLSQFAVEHLLLLPFGALIALAWVNVAPESYYRFTFADRFRRQRRRHGVLLRRDDQGGGRSDDTGRGAPPVAACAAAGHRSARRDGRPRAHPQPHRRRAFRRTDARARLAGGVRHRSRDCYFIARIIFRPQHPAIPFVLLLAIASDALGFAVLACLQSRARGRSRHWRSADGRRDGALRGGCDG